MIKDQKMKKEKNFDLFFWLISVSLAVPIFLSFFTIHLGEGYVGDLVVINGLLSGFLIFIYLFTNSSANQKLKMIGLGVFTMIVYQVAHPDILDYSYQMYIDEHEELMLETLEICQENQDLEEVRFEDEQTTIIYKDDALGHGHFEEELEEKINEMEAEGIKSFSYERLNSEITFSNDPYLGYSSGISMYYGGEQVNDYDFICESDYPNGVWVHGYYDW